MRLGYFSHSLVALQYVFVVFPIALWLDVVVIVKHLAMILIWNQFLQFSRCPDIIFAFLFFTVCIIGTVESTGFITPVFRSEIDRLLYHLEVGCIASPCIGVGVG